MAVRRSELGSLVALAVGVVLGGLVGLPLLMNKNGWGLIVLGAAPAAAVLCYRTIQRLNRNPQDEARPTDLHRLAAIAFLGSPIVACVGATACVFAFDVHPMDRASTIISTTMVAGIAGTIVAFALLATSRGN
jgi:hypothetical protein